MSTDPTNDPAKNIEAAPAESEPNIFKIQPKTVPDCQYCQLYGGGMMPPHFASEYCQSGKRNHCTCAICF